MKAWLGHHTTAGHRFTLKVGFNGDPAVDSLVLASLWLACSYGGFGARTRKGFGNVRLTYKGGPLPEGPWREHVPDTPEFDHYQELDHLPVDGSLKICADLLAGLVPIPESTDGPRVAPQPILGVGNTSATLADFAEDSWEAVAAETGERYRRFRASVAHRSPNPGYKPPIKTPEYETVIHGTDDRFPLRALGLPVNYKGGAKVTAYKEGRDELRRASPLWFRFVENEGEWTWGLFSFAFHNPFLPADQDLSIRLTGKRVENKNPGRWHHPTDHRVPKARSGHGNLRWMSRIRRSAPSPKPVQGMETREARRDGPRHPWSPKPVQGMETPSWLLLCCFSVVSSKPVQGMETTASSAAALASAPSSKPVQGMETWGCGSGAGEPQGPQSPYRAWKLTTGPVVGQGPRQSSKPVQGMATRRPGRGPSG
jgi:hypothetical protein